MKLGVTVAVCTYNGAALLPETLRHLSLQKVKAGINWEVIIIDNASTDNTSEIVATEWKKYRCKAGFYLYHQPQQGLAYARNMAFEKANYEFVLFCDDDNWLDADYVSQAYELMLNKPSIGAMGGLGELVFESEPPPWVFKLGAYANGPQEAYSGKVKGNKVFGAGCVIRKSAFNAITEAGFKPMLTDRIAKNLSAGGDYELCYAIALAGYDIWYDERLKFKHFMPKERVTPEYYKRTVLEGAQSYEVIIPYRIKLKLADSYAPFFTWKLARVILAYTKKMALLCIVRLVLPPQSDKAKLNTLKLISLRTKILSSTKYFIMRKNFIRIAHFEQKLIKLSGKNNANDKKQNSLYPFLESLKV
jgi:glycosyltransferase involved in cell wall biosynthesis